jgi:hypothetical protein
MNQGTLIKAKLKLEHFLIDGHLFRNKSLQLLKTYHLTDLIIRLKLPYSDTESATTVDMRM